MNRADIERAAIAGGGGAEVVFWKSGSVDDLLPPIDRHLDLRGYGRLSVLGPSAGAVFGGVMDAFDGREIPVRNLHLVEDGTIYFDLWKGDPPFVSTVQGRFSVRWGLDFRDLDTEAALPREEEIGLRAAIEPHVGVFERALWCVLHPDQFPRMQSARPEVSHKAHRRLARRLGVDLDAVKVVELRPVEEVERAAGQRGRAGYRFSFPVRGHWRHLPDGRVLWVAEYWKAKDRPRVIRPVVKVF